MRKFPEGQVIAVQMREADYRIQIRPLLLRPDEKREIRLQIDAETAASYGLPCSVLPQIEGVMENRAGVLMLRYRLHCVPALECGRCLSPVETQIDESFSHVIVTETADAQHEDEYLLAPDAVLDLAEVTMTDLRLSLPTKTLCRPDCKGLCPVCGQNLNESDCMCSAADVTIQFQQADDFT